MELNSRVVQTFVGRDAIVCMEWEWEREIVIIFIVIKILAILLSNLATHKSISLE